MPAVAGSKKGKKTADAKVDAVEEVKDSQVRNVTNVSFSIIMASV